MTCSQHPWVSKGKKIRKPYLIFFLEVQVITALHAFAVIVVWARTERRYDSWSTQLGYQKPLVEAISLSKVCVLSSNSAHLAGRVWGLYHTGKKHSFARIAASMGKSRILKRGRGCRWCAILLLIMQHIFLKLGCNCTAAPLPWITASTLNTLQSRQCIRLM